MAHYTRHAQDALAASEHQHCSGIWSAGARVSAGYQQHSPVLLAAPELYAVPVFLDANTSSAPELGFQPQLTAQRDFSPRSKAYYHRLC